MIFFKFIYFFHGKFNVLLMNSTFVLSHYKFRIGATMIITNNSKRTFMNKVHQKIWSFWAKHQNKWIGLDWRFYYCNKWKIFLLVRSLTSFHFNDFLKKVWYAQSVPPTVYNQKYYFLLVGSGTATTYSPSIAKFSLKYFNISQNQKKRF